MRRETDAKLLYKDESYLIQGGAFKVYKEFRNRHKESVYQKALAECLKTAGLLIDREKQIPIYFQNKKVRVYTPDITVNNTIFIELKCKPGLTLEDIKQ